METMVTRPVPNKDKINENNGQTNKDVMISNYNKDLTVLVELTDEEPVTTMGLMKAVRGVCGEMVACRMMGTKRYEVTMSDLKGKERLMEGFKINKVSIFGKEINCNEMVVSFLNMPAYIEDDIILQKLSGWGVSAVSPIKRRMWPGTNIADGTRFVKVRFNEQVQSLPYSTKFNAVSGTEYIRVIHDKQIRVCRLCIKPGHILKDCPDFTSQMW